MANFNNYNLGGLANQPIQKKPIAVPIQTIVSNFVGCCSIRVISNIPSNVTYGSTPVPVDPEALKLRLMSHEAEAKATLRNNDSSSVNALCLTLTDKQESFGKISQVLIDLEWQCTFKFAAHSYGGSIIYVWMKAIRPVPTDPCNIETSAPITTFDKGEEIIEPTIAIAKSRTSPSKSKKAAVNNHK